jgi:hypothetical protein
VQPFAGYPRISTHDDPLADIDEGSALILPGMPGIGCNPDIAGNLAG